MSSPCLAHFKQVPLIIPGQLPRESRPPQLTAALHRGDRIALIGDNGSGKSTLLRLIKELQPEAGVLPQALPVDSPLNVWELAKEPVRQLFDDLEQLETLSQTLEENPEAMDSYSTVLERLQNSGGFEVEAHLESLLSKLDLTELRERSINQLSGGERLRLALVQMLAKQPELVLMDEPTNHLDNERRCWLFQWLEEWTGAAIIVTHDLDLLQRWPQQIWHLEPTGIRIFNGSYAAYLHERAIEAEKEEENYQALKAKKKALSAALQKEETRRARTTKQGQRKYQNSPKIVRKKAIERAENTMGRHEKKRVLEDKLHTIEELKHHPRSRPPTVHFHFSSPDKASSFALYVEEGAVGYGEHSVVSNLKFSLLAGERLAICGRNGSGKTTVMRALLEDPEVWRKGSWDLPKDLSSRCAYVDQHYRVLDHSSTVGANIRKQRPDWDVDTVAKHLASFLFLHRKVIDKPVSVLSEGEKARLALALVAAQAPDLLILDEVSNNLDIRTKEHLITVLRAYPGALLINSHEEGFLQALEVEERLNLH